MSTESSRAVNIKDLCLQSVKAIKDRSERLCIGLGGSDVAEQLAELATSPSMHSFRELLRFGVSNMTGKDTRAVDAVLNVAVQGEREGWLKEEVVSRGLTRGGHNNAARNEEVGDSIRSALSSIRTLEGLHVEETGTSEWRASLQPEVIKQVYGLSDNANIYMGDREHWIEKIHLAQDICYEAGQVPDTPLEIRVLLTNHYLLNELQRNGDFLTGSCDLVNPKLTLGDDAFFNHLTQTLETHDRRNMKCYLADLGKSQTADTVEEEKQQFEFFRFVVQSGSTPDYHDSAVREATELMTRSKEILDPFIRDFREVTKSLRTSRNG